MAKTFVYTRHQVLSDYNDLKYCLTIKLVCKHSLANDRQYELVLKMCQETYFHIYVDNTFALI